jgi:hypothetical protein
LHHHRRPNSSTLTKSNASSYFDSNTVTDTSAYTIANTRSDFFSDGFSKFCTKSLSDEIPNLVVSDTCTLEDALSYTNCNAFCYTNYDPYSIPDFAD